MSLASCHEDGDVVIGCAVLCCAVLRCAVYFYYWVMPAHFGWPGDWGGAVGLVVSLALRPSVKLWCHFKPHLDFYVCMEWLLTDSLPRSLYPPAGDRALVRRAALQMPFNRASSLT